MPARYLWRGWMSVPPKGEDLPKKGKELHSARTRHEQAEGYTQAIASALKEELARGASIKTIMAWTGAGERTVKGWLAASNAPRVAHLEGLLRSSELVYERMMVRAGRKPILDFQKLEALRKQMADLTKTIDNVLHLQDCGPG